MAQRTPISAGNWKMHLSDQAADDLCRALLAGGIDRIAGVQVVLAPGFLQLGRARGHFVGTEGAGAEGAGVGVAGQTMHARDEGAFTGEVSPVQLAEVAGWVILGHSERRQYFCEDDGALRAKVAAALAHGLRPILCVGETVEERDAGRTAAVLTRQVGLALDDIDLPGDFVIAYEPVWAIGSGRAATTEQAQEAAGRIRELVRGQAGDGAADGCRILYGGSVKPGNAGDFAAQPDIDGALVGGASLDAEAFLAITRAIAAA